MALVFISHSSRDKDAVRRLATCVEDAGFSVWLDEWSIRVGECIPTRISDGLEECRFLIIVLSPHSVSSGWVDREWKAVYWAEAEGKKLRILPVLVENCSIPLLLRTRKYADLTTDWTAGLTALVASMTDTLRAEAASSFFIFTPVVSKNVAEAQVAESRNRHWDAFEVSVLSLPPAERLQVQRLNTLHYLHEWGLSIRQLRAELAALGFPTVGESDDFTDDLALAIESFQRKHCLRHIDGVFGPLTYLQMGNVARSIKETRKPAL